MQLEGSYLYQILIFLIRVDNTVGKNYDHS